MKPMDQKVTFLSSIALVILIGGCGSKTQNQESAIPSDKIRPEQVLPQAEEPKSEPLMGPKANAIRSAKQYLSFSGFSRDGLIQQLTSDAGDGYDIGDATYAVDSLNVDWNNQAVRSAKQYLSFSGFSCDRLIEQLSSEAGNKYTLSQATYGAEQAGACG